MVISKVKTARTYFICQPILLTKTTAARNGVALSYHSVRGLCFLAVVFAATMIQMSVETYSYTSLYNYIVTKWL